MAVNVTNTNYSGEVLETLLTVATTNNELVEKGLIHVIPGVSKAMFIPRLKAGKMLQKHKDDPVKSDAKGDLGYSENKLVPKDFMVFTVFNPRSLEQIWRKYQPKGDLVFAELPPHVQNQFLDVLSKQVQFELGWQYINGTYVEDGTDEQLMDGILTQMAKDDEVIVVDSSATTMCNKLKDLRKAIPSAMRANSALRILMSQNDFDTYDDELTLRDSKNNSETEVNIKRYKGITIETLAQWPDDVIVATICSQGIESNLYAGVNLQDDEHVIQIDKLTNSGESYFFKMLMKADTNIGFGEECIVLDSREDPVFTVPTDDTDSDSDNTQGTDSNDQAV